MRARLECGLYLVYRFANLLLVHYWCLRPKLSQYKLFPAECTLVLQACLCTNDWGSFCDHRALQHRTCPILILFIMRRGLLRARAHHGFDTRQFFHAFFSGTVPALEAIAAHLRAEQGGRSIPPAVPVSWVRSKSEEMLLADA